MILNRLSVRGQFGPLSLDDPAVAAGWLCPECDSTFRAGQRPALVNGIPNDPEQLLLAAEGLPYVGTCSMAHEDCVWPVIEEEETK